MDEGGIPGREVGRRDDGPDAARGAPLELHAGDLLLILEELDLEWVAAAAEQEKGGLARPRLAGTHPEVDVGVLLGAVFGHVDVEPGPIGRGQAELILAGIGGQQGPRPVDLELVRLPAGRRRLFAEIEIQGRIHAVDQLHLILGAHVGGVAIGQAAVAARQAARLGGPAPPPQRAEEIRDAFAVLADGQVGELDARRVVAGAGLRRIEGLVDVLGRSGRIGERERPGIVLRHLAGDVLGQRRDRLFADQRFVRLAGDPLADGSVATHAVLAVDDLAGAGSGQVLLVIALPLAADHDESSDDGQEGQDLVRPGQGHGVCDH